MSIVRRIAVGSGVALAAAVISFSSLTAPVAAAAPAESVSDIQHYADPSSTLVMNPNVVHMGNSWDVTMKWNETKMNEYWKSTYGAKPAYFSWINEAGGTATGCGIVQKEQALNEAAFYCPKDDVMYFDYTFLKIIDANYGREGVLSVMAHEYAHHIQREKNFGLSTTRQKELHADFLAGQYMRWLQSGNPEINIANLGNQFAVLGDSLGDKGHGSPDERRIAFENGFYGYQFNQDLRV
jgi:predicted metalloprotease